MKPNSENDSGVDGVSETNRVFGVGEPSFEQPSVSVSQDGVDGDGHGVDGDGHGVDGDGHGVDGDGHGVDGDGQLQQNGKVTTDSVQDSILVDADLRKPETTSKDIVAEQMVGSQHDESESSHVDDQEENNVSEMISWKVEMHPRFRKGQNKISTTKYKWWNFLVMNIIHQYMELSNIYFLIIMILALLPGLSPVSPITSILPVLFILSSNLIRDGIGDFLRFLDDRKSNLLKCTVIRNGEERKICTKDVNKGDIVFVRNGESVPADLVLISSSEKNGSCFIDTANLDGETNVKIRVAKESTIHMNKIETIANSKVTVYCEPPHKQYSFKGKLVLEHSDVEDGDESNDIPENEDLENEDLENEDKISVQDISSSFSGEEEKSASDSMDKENDFVPNGIDKKGTNAKASKIDEVPINISSFLPRTAILRRTKFIFGISVYTGRHTKMFKNLKKTKSKFSTLQRMLNWIFLSIISLNLVSINGLTIGSIIFQKVETKNHFYLALDLVPVNFLFYISNAATSLILLNLMIPMSLYVSLEFVKLLQAKFMMWDKNFLYEGEGLKVYSNNLNADLAKIDIIFSDKTGTLTNNEMKFRYLGVNGETFELEDTPVEKDYKITECLYCMALNNTVIPDFPLGDMNGSVQENEHSEKLESKDNSIEMDTSQTIEYEDNDTPQTSKYEAKDTPKTSKYEAKDTPKTSKYEAKDQKESIETNENAELLDLGKCYDGESPDEIAFVQTAYRQGIQLLSRTENRMNLCVNGQYETHEILALLPFDPDRKKMSIVTRKENDDKIIVYSKGADSSIIPSLASDEETEDLQNSLKRFASTGLRTLVLARKEISQEYFDEWRKKWVEAETSILEREELMNKYAKVLESSGYELIGITAIEDCLQENVPETIEFFRNAELQIWMLTGDKMETAIAVGRSCKMIDATTRVFKIKANATDTDEAISEALSDILNFHGQSNRGSYSVAIHGSLIRRILQTPQKKNFLKLIQDAQTIICCRATPNQKAQLVKIAKKYFHKLGLAIGDGANDVSMIQQARVGIGIQGKEGSQAARSADISFGRFYMLRRLLAIHGHYNLYRTSKFVQYSYYKNFLITWMQIWFSIYNGFSMQTILDGWFLQLYNTIFTLTLPFVFGLFDKDMPAEVLYNSPIIYAKSKKANVFNVFSAIRWIGNAFFHSGLVFFTSIYSWDDQYNSLGIQIVQISLLSNVVCVSKALIETRDVTLITIIFTLFSLFTHLGWLCIHAAFPVFPLDDNGDMHFVVFELLSRGTFWIGLIYIFVASQLPEIALRTVAYICCKSKKFKRKIQSHNERHHWILQA